MNNHFPRDEVIDFLKDANRAEAICTIAFLHALYPGFSHRLTPEATRSELEQAVNDLRALQKLNNSPSDANDPHEAAIQYIRQEWIPQLIQADLPWYKKGDKKERENSRENDLENTPGSEASR